MQIHFFRKNIPLTLFERVWKGYSRFYCERELQTKQNCSILTLTLLAITAFLSRSPGLLNQESGAHCAGCWFSLPHLNSNWLNFLYTELYNSSTSTFFLWASQIELIQPVHGQGYILIFLDRMHLLFTLVHFLFWLPDRVGGQYTTVIFSNKIDWLYRQVFFFYIHIFLMRWKKNGKGSVIWILMVVFVCWSWNTVSLVRDFTS